MQWEFVRRWGVCPEAAFSTSSPKVFFYLAELHGALSYALGAGPLFDVSDDSDYAQTLLGNLPGACIMTS